MLPLRELALDHGCNLVYGEELVDLGVIGTTRRSRSKVLRDGRTVDLIEYQTKSGKVVFSTTSTHGPCIFQLGTSQAATALQGEQEVARNSIQVALTVPFVAAQHVIGDVVSTACCCCACVVVGLHSRRLVLM